MSEVITKKDNLIQTKSYDFALKTIKLCKELQKDKEFVLSKQLLRSGTSIGANVMEAEAAQSRKDFINKMSIASKEARESKYWLSLIKDSQMTSIDLRSNIKDCDEIIRILTAIVKTSSN